MRVAAEVQECTFRPSLKSPQRASASAGPQRPPSGSGLLHERLYSSAARKQQELEAKAAMYEHHRVVEEREACSFRPDTSRSSKSYQRGATVTSPGKIVHPRGYDQCKQRLRRAFAGHAQRRRLLEDRFLALDVTSMQETAWLEEDRPQSSRGSPLAALSDLSPNTARFETLTSPASLPPGIMEVIAGSAGRPLPSASTFVPAPVAGAASPSAAAAARAGGAGAPPAAAAVQPSPRGARAPARGVSGSQQKPPQGTGRDNATAAAVRSRSGGAGTAVKASRFSKASDLPGSAASPETVGESDSKGYPTNTTSNASTQAVPSRGAGNAIDVVEPPPPLVYVEVNIEPGKPPERLVLREGQTPAEAAAEFAVLHHLSPQLAQRLHEQLKELLKNPELPGRGVSAQKVRS